MPRAYSIDLRERVLAACEAGEGSQARIAERYRVGERTLSGWLKAAREEGRRAPKPLGGGPKPVGGEAATLAALVAERNDATLAEYADLLADRTSVSRTSGNTVSLCFFVMQTLIRCGPRPWAHEWASSPAIILSHQTYPWTNERGAVA